MLVIMTEYCKSKLPKGDSFTIVAETLRRLSCVEPQGDVSYWVAGSREQTHPSGLQILACEAQIVGELACRQTK